MSITVIRWPTDDCPAHLTTLLPDWHAQCFSVKHHDIVWTPTEWIQWAFMDETPVSVLKILTRTVRAGGNTLLVGGIAGVMTPPALQGRGYASANMQHAADFLRDQLGMPFGLLGCEALNVPFYTRLGWQASEAEFIFDQPDASGLRFPWRDVPMILPLTGAVWPDGDIDLRGLPW